MLNEISFRSSHKLLDTEGVVGAGVGGMLFGGELEGFSFSDAGELLE